MPPLVPPIRPPPVLGAIGVAEAAGPGVRSPTTVLTGLGSVGVAVGGTGVLVGVAGVVGVGVGTVGVGVGPQFTHGGSFVTLRLRKVIVWPSGVWPPIEVGLTGLKPG